MSRRLKPSCVQCKKAKAACSETRPCPRCVKMGVECIFAPDRRRKSSATWGSNILWVNEQPGERPEPEPAEPRVGSVDSDGSDPNSTQMFVDSSTPPLHTPPFDFPPVFPSPTTSNTVPMGWNFAQGPFGMLNNERSSAYQSDLANAHTAGVPKESSQFPPNIGFELPEGQASPFRPLLSTAPDSQNLESTGYMAGGDCFPQDNYDSGASESQWQGDVFDKIVSHDSQRSPPSPPFGVDLMVNLSALTPPVAQFSPSPEDLSRRLLMMEETLTKWFQRRESSPLVGFLWMFRIMAESGLKWSLLDNTNIVVLKKHFARLVAAETEHPEAKNIPTAEAAVVVIDGFLNRQLPKEAYSNLTELRREYRNIAKLMTSQKVAAIFFRFLKVSEKVKHRCICTFANPPACALFGYDKAHFIGMELITLIAPEGYSEFYPQVFNVMALRKRVSPPIEVIFQGYWGPFRATAVSVMSMSGGLCTEFFLVITPEVGQCPSNGINCDVDPSQLT